MIATEVALRRQDVVNGASELEIPYHGRAAEGVRFTVMHLETAPLRAAPVLAITLIRRPWAFEESSSRRPPVVMVKATEHAQPHHFATAHSGRGTSG